MPRPRFQRLSAAKRERIMEAAAREFAARGYHNASLNRILQEASISKGAAYYYFDDKADLFATTVAYYATDLLDAVEPPLAALDESSFWPTVATVYEQQMEHFKDRPWAFGAIKAAVRLSSEEIESEPALQQLVMQIERRLQAILRRGQEVGAIRADLPLELLAGLYMAVDDAIDRWLLQNWQAQEAAQLRETAGRALQGLARFMAPPTEGDGA